MQLNFSCKQQLQNPKFLVVKFDLVWRMQPSDDMQNAWMMFDHVKCVQGWTTMACHVYDLVYYKVMTIVVCDMQFKDTKV
jgi:hypothetical protein